MGEKMGAHLPPRNYDIRRSGLLCMVLPASTSWQNCSTFNVSKSGKWEDGLAGWAVHWEHERLNPLKGTLHCLGRHTLRPIGLLAYRAPDIFPRSRNMYGCLASESLHVPPGFLAQKGARLSFDRVTQSQLRREEAERSGRWREYAIC